MSNSNPYKIQPHERGHRPTLKPGEPTIVYSIKLPKSMADWCKQIGSKKMRTFIESHMQLSLSSELSCSFSNAKPQPTEEPIRPNTSLTNESSSHAHSTYQHNSMLSPPQERYL